MNHMRERTECRWDDVDIDKQIARSIPTLSCPWIPASHITTNHLESEDPFFLSFRIWQNLDCATAGISIEVESFLESGKIFCQNLEYLLWDEGQHSQLYIWSFLHVYWSNFDIEGAKRPNRQTRSWARRQVLHTSQISGEMVMMSIGLQWSLPENISQLFVTYTDVFISFDGQAALTLIVPREFTVGSMLTAKLGNKIADRCNHVSIKLTRESTGELFNRLCVQGHVRPETNARFMWTKLSRGSGLVE